MGCGSGRSPFWATLFALQGDYMVAKLKPALLMHAAILLLAVTAMAAPCTLPCVQAVTGSVTSGTLTISLSSTAGHALVVLCSSGGGCGPNDGVNTYTTDYFANPDVPFWLGHVTNIPGGPLTISFGSAGATAAIVVEYQQLPASSALDAKAGVTYGGGINFPSVTTTNASDLIVGAVAVPYVSETFTAGAGYVMDAQISFSSNASLAIEHTTVSSTGNYQPTMTESTGYVAETATLAFIMLPPPSSGCTMTLMGTGPC